MSVSNDPLKIAVLFGSYRQDSNGRRLFHYVRNKLTARGHEVHGVDAKAVDLPILDRMYKEYEPGSAPENMQTLADLFQSVDGFLVVAGEYNHSVQPGLKNLMDHFLEEYLWRPSAIACYSVGGFGGVRGAMHLRAMLCEMGMPSISSILPVSKIHQSLSEDGEDKEGVIRSDRFFDEFEWFMRAMKAQRAVGTPY